MSTSEAAFTFIQEENVSILLLLPELNQVQWGEIDSIGTQVLNALASQPHPNVIVDLSQLNYMGSAMVALIVRVWKATLAKKGKLCVVCPHAGVKEVIRLASLDKHWQMVETQQDARASFGMGRHSMKPINSPQAADVGAGSLVPWVVLSFVLLAGAGIGLFIWNPALFGVATVPIEEKPTDEKVTYPPSADSAPSEGRETLEFQGVEQVNETAEVPEKVPVTTPSAGDTRPESEPTVSAEPVTTPIPEASSPEGEKE